MKLDQIHSIYFLGIGGIGMSALARYFVTLGTKVSGYDRTETPLTRQLEQEGMTISYEEDINSIPKDVDLIVYTPAISSTSVMMEFVMKLNIPLMKRAAVLGVISKSKRGLAIAGTHGKTSTTALLTHILRESGIDCTSFMGGIANNFQSNYVYGTSEWVVLEADEFDRSFLHLQPEYAVLTSTDADHLDIYRESTHLLQGFRQFLDQVKSSVIVSTDCTLDKLTIESCDAISYGIDEGQIQATQLRIENEHFMFDYHGLGHQINKIMTPFPGRHNIKNACAAISIALQLGCEPSDIKNALSTFKGVHRRFEFIYRNEDLIYIDDYAHHPTEIEAALDATRQLFPSRNITGVFQPHLYSRTRDFMHEFASALSRLDRVILLDIYPAREEPINGVTSEALLAMIEHDDKYLMGKQELLNWISKDDIDVLITLGAGDIGQLVQAIKGRLN